MIADEDYPRNASRVLNLISTFLLFRSYTLLSSMIGNCKKILVYYGAYIVIVKTFRRLHVIFCTPMFISNVIFGL